MKTFLKKVSESFYKAPILTTLKVSFIGAVFFSVIKLVIQIIEDFSYVYFSDILSNQVVSFIFILPIVLTLQNIIFLFIKPKEESKEKAIKRWEIVAITIGTIFSLLYIPMMDITFSDWNVQLYNDKMHTPIATKSFLTIVTIALLAVFSYMILRFLSLDKLPPLFAVLCISALYLGMAECILWCIQIFKITDPSILLLCLLPFNLILISIRTIRNVVYEETYKKVNISNKYKKTVKLLNNSSNWPWIAFLAAIPLLGIIVSILIIFGQEANSFIKAWTETADWNMSKKVGPQNIYQDEHYLCTVAAGGHSAVVKPIRTGKRHGHRVVVNRQLCIANAFEQLLEERTPNFHSFIRALYDKTGYPIAKHIKSPYIADLIYFIMKPLEWIFLLVLYMFDVNPENRIAVQYPHSAPPTLNQ